jgi:Holliday junction resolvasome RuvABC endonuclease subunit
VNLIGIDSSSTKIGVAIFLDGQFVFADTYTTNKKITLSDNLDGYRDWLLHNIIHKVPTALDKAVIETAHSSIRNVMTIKKLAYFEAASIIACAQAGVRVELLSASSARKRAFGNGHLSKSEVGTLVETAEPSYKFKSPDEKDAYCLALAGINGVK